MEFGGLDASGLEVPGSKSKIFIGSNSLHRLLLLKHPPHYT